MALGNADQRGRTYDKPLVSKTHCDLSRQSVMKMRFSMQAIQLAFVAIGAHVSVIENDWGGELKWENGDAGFPRL